MNSSIQWNEQKFGMSTLWWARCNDYKLLVTEKFHRSMWETDVEWRVSIDNETDDGNVIYKGNFCIPFDRSVRGCIEDAMKLAEKYAQAESEVDKWLT